MQEKEQNLKEVIIPDNSVHTTSIISLSPGRSLQQRYVQAFQMENEIL